MVSLVMLKLWKCLAAKIANIFYVCLCVLDKTSHYKGSPARETQRGALFSSCRKSMFNCAAWC